MNQYTVTFTISAQDLAEARLWAGEMYVRSRIQARIDNVVELDPETHYGAVLAEAHITDPADNPKEIERRIKEEKKAIEEETEQNSADDSSRSFDDALGQGRN